MNILVDSCPAYERFAFRELDFIRRKLGTVRLLTFIQITPPFIRKKIKHIVAILSLQDVLRSQHGFEMILEQMNKGFLSPRELDELIIILLQIRLKDKKGSRINSQHV
jgi:uncharacterized membrane protein